ncbi:hypothetical protein Hanom_Chr09g00799291 [Helianthus anomalus]
MLYSIFVLDFLYYTFVLHFLCWIFYTGFFCTRFFFFCYIYLYWNFLARFFVLYFLRKQKGESLCFKTKMPFHPTYKECHMSSPQSFLGYLGKTHFLVDPSPIDRYRYKIDEGNA